MQTERMLNDSCTVDAECTGSDRNLECREQRCQCISGHRPSLYTGGTIFCTSMYRIITIRPISPFVV